MSCRRFIGILSSGKKSSGLVNSRGRNQSKPVCCQKTLKVKETFSLLFKTLVWFLKSCWEIQITMLWLSFKQFCSFARTFCSAFKERHLKDASIQPVLFYLKRNSFLETSQLEENSFVFLNLKEGGNVELLYRPLLIIGVYSFYSNSRCLNSDNIQIMSAQKISLSSVSVINPKHRICL